MDNALVNVNGEMKQPGEASVSVFDRGFIYGDSLYEVCRTYGGRLYEIEGHMTRLKRSAELARMEFTHPLEHFAQEMQRTVDAFRQENPGTEAYCRLIVTRGTGKIGFGLKNVDSPTQYVVIVQPLRLFTGQGFDTGMSLKVSSRIRNDRRALDPAMKSGNYLNNMLAFLEAADEGYDDALLCNAEGHVTEGTTFNVFYARRGIVATPPLEVGILDGITRREMISLLRERDIPVREVLFPKERLYEADEVFITSTLKGVFPIMRVDRSRIGKGRPGPITKKLREAYERFVTERENA